MMLGASTRRIVTDQANSQSNEHDSGSTPVHLSISEVRIVMIAYKALRLQRDFLAPTVNARLCDGFQCYLSEVKVFHRYCYLSSTVTRRPAHAISSQACNGADLGANANPLSETWQPRPENALRLLSGTSIALLCWGV